MNHFGFCRIGRASRRVGGADTGEPPLKRGQLIVLGTIQQIRADGFGRGWQAWQGARLTPRREVLPIAPPGKSRIFRRGFGDQLGQGAARGQWRAIGGNERSCHGVLFFL